MTAPAGVRNLAPVGGGFGGILWGSAGLPPDDRLGRGG